MTKENFSIGDHVEWQGFKGVVMGSPSVVVQFFRAADGKHGLGQCLTIPIRDLVHSTAGNTENDKP